MTHDAAVRAASRGGAPTRSPSGSSCARRPAARRGTAATAVLRFEAAVGGESLRGVDLLRLGRMTALVAASPNVAALMRAPAPGERM